MKVYTFGDSWGAGAELKPKEITFGKIIADKLNVEHDNLAVEGSSLGVILFTLLQNNNLITDDDIVLIVVPPDVRWYGMNVNHEFYPVLLDTDEWKRMLHDKPIDWFIQHHNLFIYSIQSVLNSKGCKYIMMHNYGELCIKPEFQTLIDNNVFLSNKSLTSLLSSSDWNNYTLDSDGPNIKFTGKYFAGNFSHPNQDGHYRIAELINEKMKLYDTSK